MKFKLLKSKDDYTFEHYKTSPLAQLTGFLGTCGEAVQDETGQITLFVDPRYHTQADIQTAGKKIDIVKMSSQYSFLDYFKDFLGKNAELLVPEKSTTYAFYKKLKNYFDIIPYKTEDDISSVNNPEAPVFSVDEGISGKSTYEKIRLSKLNNCLVVNLEEIAYLLNLRSYKTNYSSTFRSKLFIQNQDKATLFCDYKLPKMPDFIEVKQMMEYEDFISRIKNEIFTDFNSISLYDFNLLKKPVNLEKNPVKKMMSKKNSKEISHYKDCFKRLDSALFAFREKIFEGMSEFELNEIFEHELKKAGAKTTSFKTILAIGENSSIIHYTACSKEKILGKNDILLLDCGGYYEGGYATDITRVFKAKNGTPSDSVKKIYTAVLKAALKAYHSRLVMTDELHSLAKSALKKYEKEGFYFPHGLGHGIGIPVHQAPPTLSPKTRSRLITGNVFTIEPGLYKEGEFGIRLENTVYFKHGEKISLSHFPYEDDLINYNMLSQKEKSQLENWQKAAL